MRRFAVILLLLGLPAVLSAQNAEPPQTLDPASLSPAALIEFEINRSYYDRYRSMVELAGQIKLDPLRMELSALWALVEEARREGGRRPRADDSSLKETTGRFKRALADARKHIRAVQSFEASDPGPVRIDPTTGDDKNIKILSDNRRSIMDDVRHKKEIAALAVQILSRIERDHRTLVSLLQQTGGRGDAREIAAERIRGLHTALSLLQAYIDELQSLDFRACGP